MNRVRHAFFVLLLAAAAVGATAGTQPVVLVLQGIVTNTTSDDTSAGARLELRLDGEKVTGRLITEKPLTGTGDLTGRLLGGWLELSGKLEGDFTIQFRGALSSHNYRGTYFGALPNGFVQYGRFDLKRASDR